MYKLAFGISKTGTFPKKKEQAVYVYTTSDGKEFFGEDAKIRAEKHQTKITIKNYGKDLGERLVYFLTKKLKFSARSSDDWVKLGQCFDRLQGHTIYWNSKLLGEFFVDLEINYPGLLQLAVNTLNDHKENFPEGSRS
jgi:hypothetical protein